MVDKNQEKVKLSKRDYDEIPVCYCANCLSLKIMNMSDDMCYCDECGSTDVKETNIDDWEIIYNERYNN